VEPEQRAEPAAGNDAQPNEQQRHRVLAGISRSRLLAVLRRSNRLMSIRELAAAVDLHPNTAREHLDQLVEAGLVTRQTAAPAGRGRPGLRYAAERSSAEADPYAYRALAGVLATELAARDDAVEAAISAGERWGAQSAGDMGPVGGAGQAIERLVGMLDDLGFAPEHAPGEAEASISLHRCPFGSLARERGDVVCNVHLGLMRGALRELGAPLDAVSLDPFVEPDLCVAHLEARTDVR
jgi:predicted ArsR family transcriptional regulator